MIALLCSVKTEADQLLGSIVDMRSATLGSKLMVEGKLNNQPILLCIGGVGKVNAAHAATLMVSRFNPEALVVFGIGGAYPSSGARIGDIAIAQEEIAGDEGVLTREGFKDTEYMGIPLLKTTTSTIYSTFHANEHLMNQALQSLDAFRTPDHGALHVGSFITLSTCTGTHARARELEERYQGLCENMEGAAAAQVAELHSVPWLEVRGISNIVQDRDLITWDILQAAETAQLAIQQILEKWTR